MELNQYDIILVNLDPTKGSEIRKTRPCLIVSPNEVNRNLNTITIAPLTTKAKNYPTRVKVRHNQKVGWVAIDQIRTIDKSRAIKTLGRINYQEISKSKSVIKETFVD